MQKSIIQADRKVCFLCGRNGNWDPLECHHVFSENPTNRTLTRTVLWSGYAANGATGPVNGQPTNATIRTDTLSEKPRTSGSWKRERKA